MAELKILYFHQHFSTPKGSTGTRSYEMAQAAIKAGHEVTMVCGSFGVGCTGLDGPFTRGMRSDQVDGIDIIEFNLNYSNNLGLLLRAWIFTKFAFMSMFVALTYPYDILFATSTPLTAGIPGILGRWLRRKTFVFEVRDLWPELPKAMGVITNPVLLFFMSVIEWASYRSAHRLIGLSPGICEGIISRGVSSSKVRLVPNGCDLEIFNSETTLEADLSDIKSDDLLVVFTGTHGPANGLDAVLDAASILQKKGKNEIKIMLVGDGKLKPLLIKRADEEGLSNVIFKAPVPKHELAKILKRADVGMQILANVPAFYYGTSPNKFFDYLSAGLPVLNNYPGWIASMINKNKCGYAIKPDDPEAFSQALIHAEMNRDKLLKMGINAKQLAIVKFDRTKLSKDWVNWVIDEI